MNNTPLISILMTSYNTEKYIAEAVRSIINQTYTNWELLIADDFSTDNTRTIIDSFQDNRILKYHNEHKIHYLRTRNKLINYVKGEFITLLDSDDIMHPNRLEIQLSRFKKDSELALCGCQIKYIDALGNDMKISNPKPCSDEEIKEVVKNKNPFTGSSILVKFDVFKSFGGYRDFFSGIGNEDYDLTSRIIEKHKAINIEDVLYYYRQYPHSSSRSLSILFDPYRHHGDQLVKFFISERQTKGADSLEKQDYVTIRNFIIEKNKPYLLDPSKIYRELAAKYMHTKFYTLAIRFSGSAIVKKPFNIYNYRTFLYCLRKSIIALLFYN